MLPERWHFRLEFQLEVVGLEEWTLLIISDISTRDIVQISKT